MKKNSNNNLSKAKKTDGVFHRHGLKVILLVVIMVPLTYLGWRYYNMREYQKERIVLDLMLLEAVSWYACTHDGKLPDSMDNLINSDIFEVQGNSILMHRFDIDNTYKNNYVSQGAFKVKKKYLMRFEIVPGLHMRQFPDKGSMEDTLFILPPPKHCVPLDIYYLTSYKIQRLYYQFLEKQLTDEDGSSLSKTKNNL